ncbi:MAG: FixH family protein [Gammaproteobacteria bacterium]|nr:FixH family protein [Gammaproteobacteria bacterium]
MNDASQQSPWYRMPMVWMLILIPASSVVMGIVMIWLAITNDDGLVVDDYYRKGKTINKVLKRDVAAVNYGLEADIQFDYELHQVTMKLTAGTGFDRPDRIIIHFFNATRTGLDKTGVFTHSGNSLYTASFPELNHGRWYIQVEANNWRLLGSLSVPDNSKIHIRAIE